MAWKIRVAVLLLVTLNEVVTAQLPPEPYEGPVVIPRCCQEGFSFDSEHTCTPDTNKPFHPPAVVGESSVLVHSVQNTDTTQISCEAEEMAVYGSTIYGETILFIEGDSVRLGSVQNGEVERPEQFCIAREISEDKDAVPNYVAKFCMPDRDSQIRLECADSTCVRKCCAPGKYLVRTYCEPISGGEDWRPVFSSDNKTISPPSDLKLVHGFPSCTQMLIYDDHTLLPTGNLMLSGHTTHVMNYCIDLAYDEATGSTREMALRCLGDDVGSKCPWKSEILLPVLMGISCVFLLVTWVVYISVWQLRTCTTGRCLISFISAMIVAFVTLMILNLYTNSSDTECAVTGRLAHFSILAMFFWLNVLSLHIFSVARSGKMDSKKRFLLYSLYAWGCPLVVTMVGLVLDLKASNVIRPHILDTCWLIDSTSKWVYMYGIVLALLVVNMVLFIASVKFIKQADYSPNIGCLNHNISCRVYFKLLILTGILWVTDVIIWATTDVGLTEECDILHIIFDIINGLQGVYVFVVAVCLRKDLKVFHCGLPKLVPVVGGSEIPSNPHEVSELVNNA